MTDFGAREGHFLLESGHHGTLWLDLDSLFLHPAALVPAARELAARVEPFGPEVICGPLTGGAFLAAMVAAELGVAFTWSSPAPPASGGLYSRAYDIPASLHPHHQGRRTAVIDDVINAGSAVTATLAALTDLGAEVVVAASLLTLGEKGRDRLVANGIPLQTLESRPNDLYPPDTCPLCAAGIPLQT